MTSKDIILVVALLSLAAAIKQEHPPHHHGHHQNAVPVNPEVAPSNIPAAQPSFVQESVEHVTQDYSEQDEDEFEDEAGVDDLKGFLARKSIPTTCDSLTLPMYSCYNCYSYLVCKPDGGKIKACKDPYAPYCNNGVCSKTPSVGCSTL